MTSWVNFAEIRQKVSLEQVITNFYGITTLKRDGTKMIGPCPVHQGDNPRAFHADLEKNAWHCFSKCGKGGNQLDFVAAKEGISIREAALKLQAFFLKEKESAPSDSHSPSRPGKKIPTTETEPRIETVESSPPETKKVARNPILKLELQLKSDHPHLLQDRGLDQSTVEHFGVGYCSRGILRGTIAIPIHDEDGNLVAYVGRNLKPQVIREQGKYKLPKGFHKDIVLFNFHRTKEVLRKDGVILLEGFFAVMKLHAIGLENVVACMGSDLSDAQAELLTYAKEVIVLFDGDDAGRNGSVSAMKKLEERNVIARVAHLPEGTKPDDLSPRLLRWLVNGLQGLDLAEVRFETGKTEVGRHG
jgi:DNA primase